MKCIDILDGTLCFSNITFNCPLCDREYIDSDEKYLNRCNNNKNFCTKITCECGGNFMVSLDYKGDFVSFINKKNNSKSINYKIDSP